MKTYTITTFGCQMNISDSERVAAVCRSMGYSECLEGENADLYVLNTCSIRQKAEDRVLGMGKKFFVYKKDKPDTKVILTGCMAKRDIRQGFEKSDEYQKKYGGSLQKRMPWLDYVLEINDIHLLPKVLGVETSDKSEDYFAVKPKYNSKFQAYVPISTGCNKFCTFCIVPFTRGKEVYRPFAQIHDEVEALVKSGYKEITLLGQNVNSWRNDNLLRTPITSLVTEQSRIKVKEKLSNQESLSTDPTDFAGLMQTLAQIKGEFWLRFTSSHPYDINMQLIDVMASEKNIAKQIHFALQSGSSSVLKRMNRYYTREEFRDKVFEIKNKIPDISLTTDVIVGFSGETEDEFTDTVDLCKELRFDQIFISEYSRREGTIAAKFYSDDISNEIKSSRKLSLDNALKEWLVENNSELIGTNQKVLIYKRKVKNREGIFGRTNQNKEILINISKNNCNVIESLKHCCSGSCSSNTELKPGEFVNVKVTGFKGFCLEGELISKPCNQV